MTRARPSRRLLVAALVFLAVAGAAALWAVAAHAQWHLDVERAMDAVGVSRGMIVGEAGAGDGYFTLPMAARVGPSGLVYANDISRRALSSLEEHARRQGVANVRTVVGEEDDPRFPRKDLDLLVVVHAFHDFSKPVEWLVNAKKYLRAGATVAIIDRDPDKGGGSHFWTRERIEGYAASAGYELVKSVEVETDHLVVVFTPRDRPAR